MPTKPESPILYLGNPVPHESQTEDGRTVGFKRLEGGAAITEVHLQPSIAEDLRELEKEVLAFIESHVKEQGLVHLLTGDVLSKAEIALKHLAIVVAQHAAEGIDWVAGEEKKLVAIIAAFLGAEVKDVPAVAGEDPLLETLREGAELMGIPFAEIEHQVERWPEIIARLDGEIVALKTKAGVDLFAQNCFGTSAAEAQANYVALTTTAITPAAGDTTLSGEITTAEGGLLRAKATYSHTGGEATCKLVITFTANSHDTLPSTVKGFGIFNKSVSGGTMAIEATLTETTFNAINDNATLTETVTFS